MYAVEKNSTANAFRAADGTDIKASLPSNITLGGKTLQSWVIAAQHPTSANGYTWYRKYSDGWVEQGGKSTSDGQTVTFPIQMANTEYFISGMPYETDTGAISSVAFASKTTTSVVLYGKRVNAAGFAAGAHPVYWEVKGMAA
jgi:hypothetical protein